MAHHRWDRMHMKTLLLASTVFLTATGAACAADAVTQESAAEIIPAGFVWTGGYVGLQGGYALTNGEVGGNGATYMDDRFGGGLLGVHAGYNWQSGGSFVGGIEMDVEHVWNKHGFSLGGGPAEMGTGWQGSARLRAGYAVDRTLLFATGGVAMTSGYLKIPADGYDHSKTFVGWTIGAGIEHAFTDNWTGRVEYRYADFGSQSFPIGFDLNFKQQSLRAGISYKF